MGGEIHIDLHVDQVRDEHHQFVADPFENQFGIGFVVSPAFLDIAQERVWHMFVDVVEGELLLVDLHHIDEVRTIH